MKPQIQLSFYLPETLPQDSAFPIRVATLKLQPPRGRSTLSFDVAIDLARTSAGVVEGYAITLNGQRVDPETIDTLPEATARATMNFCHNVVPQWLQAHIREYATTTGLERAFARREGWDTPKEDDDRDAEPGTPPQPVPQAEAGPAGLGELGAGGAAGERPQPE